MALLNLAPARAAVAVAAVSAIVCAASSAQTNDPGEHAVKAAFLHNFTKFVDWPPSAFDGASGPFVVCVYVDPPFGRVIDAMLAEESVGGRPIRVVKEPSDARRCHIAYFGGADAERLLPTLRQSPVLTVGEGPRFLQRGGLISFVLDKNRVRFDVNKPAVDKAGLTISSKLLRVARRVETKGP